MNRQPKQSKVWLFSLLVSSLLPQLLQPNPAWSHEVEVAAEVAATFHIEPNHNPRAGEAAQAWFALTRRGGALIPLSECNCKLAVYLKVSPAATQPILQPALQAINAEQYRGIPGAKIVFPEAGEYELRLTGSAKPGANFQPFTFRYQVLVRPGQAAVTPVASESTPATTTIGIDLRPEPVGVFAGLAGLFGIAWFVASRRR